MKKYKQYQDYDDKLNIILQCKHRRAKKRTTEIETLENRSVRNRLTTATQIDQKCEDQANNSNTGRSEV
jgi:hypothetical protein